MRESVPAALGRGDARPGLAEARRDATEPERRAELPEAERPTDPRRLEAGAGAPIEVAVAVAEAVIAGAARPPRDVVEHRQHRAAARDLAADAVAGAHH